MSGHFFTLEKQGKLYVARCNLCEYRAIAPSEKEAVSMMYNHYREAHEVIVYRKPAAGGKSER